MGKIQVCAGSWAVWSPNFDDFLDLFNIVSGGFVAAPPLINNCSALWNSEKAMETGKSCL